MTEGGKLLGHSLFILSIEGEEMLKTIFAGIPAVQKALVLLGLIVSIAYCSKSKDLEIAVRDNTIIQNELTDVREELKVAKLEREKIATLNGNLIKETQELRDRFQKLETNTRTQFAELAGSLDGAAIAPELSGSVEAINRSAAEDPNTNPILVKPVKVIEKEKLDRAFKISIDAMYDSYCLATGKCGE